MKSHPYIKHLIHFHYKCEEKDHELFVHFCSGHPRGTTLLAITGADGFSETKCFYKKNHIFVGSRMLKSLAGCLTELSASDFY